MCSKIKIDIRGYVIQMEVHLSRDLKSRNFLLYLTFAIFYKWCQTIDMRSMTRQITMFQAPMLLNF